MQSQIEKYDLTILRQQYFHSLDICCTLIRTIKTELEGSDFLSENAEDFARLLLRILEVVSTHLKINYSRRLEELDKARQTQKSPLPINKWVEEYDKLEKNLYSISLIVFKLTPLIKYIHGAKAEVNQWGLVAQIDRFCRKLSPQARVIVRPRWAYLYSYQAITRTLFELAKHAARFDDPKLSTAISKCIFPEGLKKSSIFASLAYPPISAENILHMAIWAHEIGHFVDNIEGIRAVENADSNISPARFISIFLADKIEDKQDFQKLKPVVDISPKLNKEQTEKEIGEKIIEPLTTVRFIWAREIFADIFSVRICGPAAIFALMQYARRLNVNLDVISTINLPIRYRLKYMLKAYTHWFGDKVQVNGNDEDFKELVELYNQEIASLQSIAARVPDNVDIISNPNMVLRFITRTQFSRLFRSAFPSFIENIDDLVVPFIDAIEQIISDKDCYLTREDLEPIFIGAREIEKTIPPDFIQTSDILASDKFNTSGNKELLRAVNAGWIAWIYTRRNSIGSKKSLDDLNMLDAFTDINTLLLKSIENAEVRHWFDDRKTYGESKGKDREKRRTNFMKLKKYPAATDLLTGGMLHQSEILKRVMSNGEDQIVIRPLLDSISQIGTCSLDIRLGNTFLLTKRPSLAMIDPIDFDIEYQTEQIARKIVIPYGKPFILHPGQFVLSSSLEYISMPPDLSGILLDRESYGRLGLVLAISGKIIPRYKGCITLSFTNLGNAPIHMYPCARIGQIVFFNLANCQKPDEEKSHEGKNAATN